MTFSGGSGGSGGRITEAAVPEAALRAAILAAAAVYGDAPQTAMTSTSRLYRRSKTAAAAALYHLGFAAIDIADRVGVSASGVHSIAGSTSARTMPAVAAAVAALEVSGLTMPVRARPTAGRPLGPDVAGPPSADCAGHVARVSRALGGMMFPVLVPVRAPRVAGLGPG